MDIIDTTPFVLGNKQYETYVYLDNDEIVIEQESEAGSGELIPNRVTLGTVRAIFKYLKAKGEQV